MVDFALHDINKPMGVSEYTYKQLPDDLRNSLPSVEQIENELNRFDEEES